MREAYFHEDDYRQIEILPIDNLAYCLEQIGEIEKSATVNFDGLGYKDVYVREENPSQLASLNLKSSILEETLVEFLPKFDAVYTGYSTYKEKCGGVVAFGKDKGEQIYFEDSEDVVTTIWVSDPFEALTGLPSIENLLFVDWSWGFVCPLSEKEIFLEYIKDRDLQMEEYLDKMKALYPQKIDKKPWWKFW